MSVIYLVTTELVDSVFAAWGQWPATRRDAVHEMLSRAKGVVVEELTKGGVQPGPLHIPLDTARMRCLITIQDNEITILISCVAFDDDDIDPDDDGAAAEASEGRAMFNQSLITLACGWVTMLPLPHVPEPSTNRRNSLPGALVTDHDGGDDREPTDFDCRHYWPFVTALHDNPTIAVMDRAILRKQCPLLFSVGKQQSVADAHFYNSNLYSARSARSDVSRNVNESDAREAELAAKTLVRQPSGNPAVSFRSAANNEKDPLSACDPMNSIRSTACVSRASDENAEAVMCGSSLPGFKASKFATLSFETWESSVSGHCFSPAHSLLMPLPVVRARDLQGGVLLY